MTKAELHYVLFVVAGYLSPDSTISYGKLVELLRNICPGLRYSDVYPLLFNARFDISGSEDPFAVEYDWRAAGKELRRHMQEDHTGQQLLESIQKLWGES